MAQGGFAGTTSIARAPAPKFAGLRTCPTFNFNGDPKGALLALSTERIASGDLVSKNVTHGVAYDAAFHERMRPHRDARPASRSFRGDGALPAAPAGGEAASHRLAACAAIDRDIFTWAEVEVVREQGEWGRGPRGERNSITVSVDRERFFSVLAARRGAS